MKNSYKYCIVKFIKFISNELNLKNKFKITLSYTRSDDLKTYAYYNPQTSDVKIYCKNRGLADILRSIAHELIHHYQNENGELTQNVQDIGGKIEDDANSIAGQFVKKFGYDNPDFKIYDSNL